VQGYAKPTDAFLRVGWNKIFPTTVAYWSSSFAARTLRCIMPGTRSPESLHFDPLRAYMLKQMNTAAVKHVR
jgi:hypothetical protein